MESRASPKTIDQDRSYIVLEEFRAAPLLELYHHIRRRAGARMLACENRICPLAGEREPVLDEYLHVSEPGLDQVLAEQLKPPLPRPNPGRFPPRHVPCEHRFQHRPPRSPLCATLLHP